jgi:hypothetical protein
MSQFLIALLGCFTGVCIGHGLKWLISGRRRQEAPAHQIDTALADRIRDAIEAQRLAGVETGAAYEAWRLQQERDNARRIMGVK